MQGPPDSSADGLTRADAADFARAVTGMRARHPRVHCVTNAVAQNFTANVLLAAGCLPSMTMSPEEIGAFVARADALLVNLGTFDRERRAATMIAVDTARGRVPVFIDRSEARAAFARELVAQGPAVVRLNHAEFETLSGEAPAREALAAYARTHKVTVALSGETDLVTDGARMVAVANGHPLMARVTAMGCAVSALVAACLAGGGDALHAAAGGLVYAGVAGERAAGQARGPGGFAANILDEIYALDAAALTAAAKVG